MNRCTLASLCSFVLGGFLLSMVVPSHPEKPFVEEVIALKADNAALTQQLIDLAKAQVEEEKKRTSDALKSCGR